MLLLGPTGAAPAAAGSNNATIEQIKGAFLVNFGRLVKWPVTETDAETSPTVIGVYGDPSVYDALVAGLAGRSPSARTILIEKIVDVGEAKTCQILYIGGAAAAEIEAILAVTATHPVLTVGDGRDFIDRGGIISLLQEGGRVRFAINRRNERDAGLQISSKLLRLARDVIQ